MILDREDIFIYLYEDEILNGNIKLKEENDGLGVVVMEWNSEKYPEPTYDEIQTKMTELADVALDYKKKRMAYWDAENYINNHLNVVSHEKGYSSALSIASYLSSKNDAWKDEAQRFVDWRDSVWAYVFQAKEALFSRPYSDESLDLFIQGIPKISW